MFETAPRYADGTFWMIRSTVRLDRLVSFWWILLPNVQPLDSDGGKTFSCSGRTICTLFALVLLFKYAQQTHPLTEASLLVPAVVGEWATSGSSKFRLVRCQWWSTRGCGCGTVRFRYGEVCIYVSSSLHRPKTVWQALGASVDNGLHWLCGSLWFYVSWWKNRNIDLELHRYTPFGNGAACSLFRMPLVNAFGSDSFFSHSACVQRSVRSYVENGANRLEGELEISFRHNGCNWKTIVITGLC